MCAAFLYVYAQLTIIPIKKCTPSLKINNSYSILCPQIVNKDPIKVEKAAQLILDFIQLPDDQYRLGKTKVHPRNIKRILFN